jgi:uncharacterized protein (DUF58 family)
VNFIKNTYLTRWFFVLFAANILLAILSYTYPPLMFVSNVVLASLIGLTIVDAIILYSNKSPITIKRTVNSRLNLGDENKVELRVKNHTNQPISFKFIEGYPIQMQEREKFYQAVIASNSEKQFEYIFVPKERGKFEFGSIFVMVRSLFFLCARRIEIDAKETVHVYPSVLQMRQYELLVFQQQKVSSGIKKIRRLGNNSEFEQIKTYNQGDEIKKINWKATSRRNELMVNQYQEEKSQNVYCIIDKSRNMQMEFEQLSMLDYAINSTLVFSNIALRKGDKAGLITFSDKIGSMLMAERSTGQLRKIQEALYNQKSLFKEASFELLYQSIRKSVRSRSLLMLFSNFETEFSLKRAIPVLRKLNQKHVLVVVIFENSQLQDLAYQQSKNTFEVYQSTVAERMLSVKSKMARELRQNGIQTIVTLPEDLSVKTINKYLELKAKGSI